MTPRPLFTLLSVALLTSTCSLAQQPAPPAPNTPPAAGAPAPIVRPHGSQQNGPQRGAQPRMSRDMSSGRGGAMTMGSHSRMSPGGMWWKSPQTIQLLTLTPVQQARMDDIFQKSRIQLIDLKATVEKQEVTLEPMLDANPPDTNKVLAEIDHLAQARAELEKANARMLLGIRGVLTSDQWTKLQAARRDYGPMNFDKSGRGGPGGRPGDGPMGHHDGMAGGGPGGPGFMMVDPEISSLEMGSALLP
jgi:Spy/CpxP family protein refolding chaperone